MASIRRIIPQRAHSPRNAPRHGRFVRTVATLAVLLTAQNAFAGNILRRASGASAMSPDATASQIAAAQAAAAARAQAQRTDSPLRRALEAVKRAQQAQDAARAAAQSGPSAVPNGLGVGGLDVAQGKTWTGAAKPQESEEGGRKTVAIAQEKEKAILTWTTFNVGRETDLVFDQSAGGSDARNWAALNRVEDPKAQPSKILGSIRAEGQVFVVNRNGIIFGGASQVNVGTLVASTMDFAEGGESARNAYFELGILSRAGQPVFAKQESDAPADIVVDGGARLEVAPYGQIALLGGGVTNAGSLTAPDGQVLLASGKAIALTQGAASDIPGFLLSNANLNASGAVLNAGLISTPRGDITLSGSRTEQRGMLVATTGAEANGTITIGTDHGGESDTETIFGEGSITQVLPDGGPKKVIGGGSAYKASQVEVMGKEIAFLTGSTVYAPGGNVLIGRSDYVTASPVEAKLPDEGRIYVEQGARIDVSGLRDVLVPMEQNSIRAELRASELADNFILRYGPLRGRTVYFDGRIGVRSSTDLSDPGVANLSGYYELIERDVTQLMTTGGGVTLKANEIVAREGSVIDISGGSVQYLDGYIRSTTLVEASGRRVRIEEAKPGVRYVGIDGEFVVDHPRWGQSEVFVSALSRSRPRFERGYVEGRGSGSLTLDTNGNDVYSPSVQSPNPSATGAFRVLDGEIVAGVVVGPKQRETATGSNDPTRSWRERPSGGRLNLFHAADVRIENASPRLAAEFERGQAIAESFRYDHLLPSRLFDGETITNLAIDSGYTDDRDASNPARANLAPGGHLHVAAGVVVNLGDGGTLDFRSGKGAEIDGTVLAPGGSVKLKALHGPYQSSESGPSIRIGSGAVIDVAGRYTNEFKAGAPRGALDGGDVELTSTDIVLEVGSLVDVSGGARLEAGGTKVKGGKGGSITLDVSKGTEPTGARFEDRRLTLEGELRGFAVGTGGKLTLNTSYDVFIGVALPADAGPKAWLLHPEFFTIGGFSSYTILGERSLTVLAGTELRPSREVLVLEVPAEIVGEVRLSDVAARRPDGEATGLPSPMTLDLQAVPQSDEGGGWKNLARDLVIEDGASIVMKQPGSSLSLKAAELLEVQGTLRADGGTINLTVTGAPPEATQADWGTPQLILGKNARILAPGYVRTVVDGALVRRSVEAGGAIELEVGGSDTGAGALRIDPEALLDVSGAEGYADLLAPTKGKTFGSVHEKVWVSGSAGRISISLNDGAVGLVTGQLDLSPGERRGEPSGGGGVLEIRSEQALAVAKGQSIHELAEFAVVDADALNRSGADDLILGGPAIRFDGEEIAPGVRTLSLSTLHSITLAAGQIGTLRDTSSDIRISSAYVRLEGSREVLVPVFPADPVSGSLTVSAGLIDVVNTTWLGCPGTGFCGAPMAGFKTARFESSGDIRLTNTNSSPTSYIPSQVAAGLFSPAAIELEALQVYVTSREDNGFFSMVLNDADPGYLIQSGTSVVVRGKPGPAAVPLSFGERLTIRAPLIEQGGVLRAPQGQIRLEATGPDGEIRLLPGSVTSVALEGVVVPYGQAFATTGLPGYASQAPAKVVTLDGASIDVQGGAVIDVAGGGDLVGYDFLPGDGGKVDVLGTGGFAILPSLGAAPAPVAGTAALSDSSLEVGDAVYLKDVPGLPDGQYTLLPAHYALLPGGYYVRPIASSGTFFSSAPKGFVRADGTAVVAGYRVAGGEVADPGWTRFDVMSRDVIDQFSRYHVVSFNDWARERDLDQGVVTRRPLDAGAAVIRAGESLNLHGSGRFGAGADGLLGNLDISAQRIAVTGDLASSPGDGWVVLDPGDLSAFGAGSILLGGTRSAASKGTSVAVIASDVRIDTGGIAFVGPEILLAAKDSVTVASGSVIRAEALGQVSVDTNDLLLTGNGALLRLSTGERVGVVRSGEGVGQGVLDIGAATIAASRSVALEGSNAISIASAAEIETKQVDLAARRVNVGDVPAGEAGVVLGPELLKRFGASSDLLVRGHESIHMYGGSSIGSRDATTGKASLGQLTLDTPLLEGHAAADETATVSGASLTLRNSGSTVAIPAASGGTGQLVLDIDRLALGPGNVVVAGYASLASPSTGSIGSLEAVGSGSLAFAGDVSLSAKRVSAASGVDYTLGATGRLSLFQRAGGAAPLEVSSLGGRLTFEASSIALDTQVVLPAGAFEAIARGGSIELGAHAVVDVSGVKRSFLDADLFAPGGSVRLAAVGAGGGTGNVAMASGARLDVSGADEGGDAGLIDIRADGDLTVQAELGGRAAAGYRGGSLALDMATLGGGDSGAFTVLNRALEAEGFREARSLRLREQRIELAAGETITAHRVLLRSDAGSILVSGTIDARGSGEDPDGGLVRIEAGNGFVLAATARIDASAGMAAGSGFDPSSGTVELVAHGGRVDLAPGSSIDVSGGQRGGGVVVVRAPRVGEGDIAVDRLGVGVVGERRLVLQGVAEYQATLVDGALVGDAATAGTLLGDSAAWHAAAPLVIRSRRGADGWAIAPAVQVTSDGNLTIGTEISVGGTLGAGHLAFVARGDLDVSSSVSDGFASAARDAALLEGESAGLALEGGGDVRIGAGALVRTGTGDITVEAGRDFVLEDRTAVLYTAGRSTRAEAGFLGAPAGRLMGELPTDGGSIRIAATRDVRANELPQQTTSAWLFRHGAAGWNGVSSDSTVVEQTSWSIVFKNFEDGIGALGGGGVRVSAGRDTVDLHVAIPSTGHLTTDPGTRADPGKLFVRGGGDLDVQAARDVRGGLFMLGRGEANVRAGGSIARTEDRVGVRNASSQSNNVSQREVGVLFGLMDASAHLVAGQSVDVEGVFDPARQGQIQENLTGGDGSSFWGYSERAALDVTALAGAVAYSNNPWASVDPSAAPWRVSMTGAGPNDLNQIFGAAPPSLRLASLGSKVELRQIFTDDRKLTMQAAAVGNLELLARDDISIASSIEMSATAPEYRRGPLAPYATRGGEALLVGSVVLSTAATNNLRGTTPIHALDQNPARIWSDEGRVCAGSGGLCKLDDSRKRTIELPKPLEVYAGRDIIGGKYVMQNNRPLDVSWLEAGRDIIEPDVNVLGIGALVLEAGRDVRFNYYRYENDRFTIENGGVGSVHAWGNTYVADVNSALPEDRAADVIIMAGTGGRKAPGRVDYDSFSATYLDAENAQNVSRTYLDELAGYMESLGYDRLEGDALLQAFDGLSDVRRRIFLDTVLLTELKETGIDYNDPESPRFQTYDRGFDAIARLFPADRGDLGDHPGDVILNGRQVYTDANGDITILAPYGGVLVGSPTKDSRGKGGVVTRRGGNVRIFADGDIALETSRVFTLQGGDITMWTSSGSITAGTGSKTSVFQAPIELTMDADGVVTVDAFGIATGAGIGVLDALQGTDVDRARSRLDLIAPLGEVNAGDAGIRVNGDLNIAALTVVGMENIQVSGGGTATGVPQIEAPNVVALTTASELSRATSQEGIGPATQPKNTIAELPSIITVEVVGYETEKKGDDEGPRKDNERKN